MQQRALNLADKRQKGWRDNANERRQRAQLHVNYNLHVALNCEQLHSQKKKEKEEGGNEGAHETQVRAARLLNINSFIYM